MNVFLVGILLALWLGILTSISPCPLATNIAAISFIAKQVSRTRQALLSGIFYVVGRMATYLVLGMVVVGGLLSMPEVSNFLQRYMNRFLGPLLVVVGMFLLELIPITLPGIGGGEKLQKRAERGGVWGAGLLGVVFALSFCPISAALFFGSLIPLSVKHNSPVLMPALYGFGTGLPVLLFAVLIVLGAKSIGKTFTRLSLTEQWARRITGVVFVLAGIYISLRYIFGVFTG